MHPSWRLPSCQISVEVEYKKRGRTEMAKKKSPAPETFTAEEMLDEVKDIISAWYLEDSGLQYAMDRAFERVRKDTKYQDNWRLVLRYLLNNLFDVTDRNADTRVKKETLANLKSSLGL